MGDTSDNRWDGIGKRMLADTVAAATAGFCVTPIISAVDRALAENASGKASLWPSFFNSFKEMAAAPLKFVRSPQFGWVWLTYGSTYWAANTAITMCDRTNTDVAFPKWIATSVTNTSTCIAKDKAYARMFGTKVAAKVPITSYTAWLARDLISMGVFFTLPPIIGKEVAKYTGSERSGYYAAQIVLPLAAQTVTTPVHLLGYDFYNNPETRGASARIDFMKKDYFKNVSARVVRMAPPWSFGTIGNKEMRDKLNTALGNDE